MRSSSALEWAGIALGAAAQAVWCGAFAAALTGSAWPPFSLFAVAVMIAAVVVTRWAGGDEARLRRGRVLLAAVLLAASGLLLVGGRAWAHDFVVWQIVRDVAFVTLLVVLGVLLVRDRQAPDDAVRRAIRAFALLCAVLVCAALAGAPVGWAAAAVAASLVAGGLHVAVVRHRALTDLVADADRLPALPWLIAVAAAIGGVLAVAALVALLLDASATRGFFDALLGVLRYALDVLGWLVGWAGAGILRALAWLAGLVDLRLPQLKPPPLRPTMSAPSPTPGHTTTGGSGMLRLVVTALAAAAAVAASVAVVALAFRRLRRSGPREDRVVEEREAVRSVSSGAADALGGLGRRLRRFVRRPRREPRSPAELIRLRYEQLEARLAKAGRPRAPGVTVRAYLGACAGNGAGGEGQAPAVSGGGPAATDDLAGLYELARYSSQVVDEAAARRFEELARDFGAPASV